MSALSRQWHWALYNLTCLHGLIFALHQHGPLRVIRAVEHRSIGYMSELLPSHTSYDMHSAPISVVGLGCWSMRSSNSLTTQAKRTREHGAVEALQLFRSLLVTLNLVFTCSERLRLSAVIYPITYATKVASNME
jgi:hypothetical protein